LRGLIHVIKQLLFWFDLLQLFQLNCCLLLIILGVLLLKRDTWMQRTA
jgi:hypothetical protein